MNIICAAILMYLLLGFWIAICVTAWYAIELKPNGFQLAAFIIIVIFAYPMLIKKNIGGKNEKV